MKTYFKYLLKKPFKILWLLFIYSLSGIFLYNALFMKFDDGLVVNTFLTIFSLILIILASYQPYKEWKDGHNI